MIHCYVKVFSFQTVQPFYSDANFLSQDTGLDHGVVAESFETSVPWDRVSAVVTNTKHRIETECIGNEKKISFVNQKSSVNRYCR